MKSESWNLFGNIAYAFSDRARSIDRSIFMERSPASILQEIESAEEILKELKKRCLEEISKTERKQRKS